MVNTRINAVLNPTDKQILALAIPMILSNITVPLLGLVDTAVIGHLPEAYYLGGSTVGAMIITFVTWLCGFLRMSTTGLSAQALGKADAQESLVVLFRGITVAFVIGLTLVVLQSPYISFALSLAGGSEEVQFYAQEYAQIRVWGLPAALANIVMLGWLLGQHKAKAVMWLLIATNLINLVLDLLFVLVFDWKVAGVATATVIAEYSGFIIAIAIVKYGNVLTKSQEIIFSAIKAKIIDLQELGKYFRLNRDILIRTLCLELCFVFMTFKGARLGDDIVAANAILMNFLLLISFGLDGIANAAEALIGKAHGERANGQMGVGDKHSFRYIISRCTLWTLGFAFVYTLLFLLAGEVLIGLMTDINVVKETALTYLPWLILLPLLGCWCYLYDGIYVGMTRADIMRNSMLIATFALFFPLWFAFSSFENHGLWLAFSGFMIARGATLGWHLYRRVLV